MVFKVQKGSAQRQRAPERRHDSRQGRFSGCRGSCSAVPVLYL